MNNTVEVVNVYEIAGDKFITIAIINEDGDAHLDVLSELSLAHFIQREVEISVDDELVDEVNNAELKYIELTEDDDGLTGESVYDIYYHKIEVEDNIVKIDDEGELLKTYKNDKLARKFVSNFSG